jgi:LacI family transcriptional regulator
MATIKSVAEQAGVSIASVSRVINGTVARGDTEERVWKAIKALDYQPNSAARALKVRKSEQICLSFDDLANPAYAMMTRGVGQSLGSTSYRLVLASAFSSVEEIVKHLETMGRGFADGLIISPIYSDKRITKLLSNLQIPVVVIGTLPDGINADNVWVDSAAGVEAAVVHLKDIGRKKIGFLNGPLSTNPGRKRLAAFQNALVNNGLKSYSNNVFQADAFSPDSAYQAISDAKSLSTFDSILCANDQLAAGLMKYCGQHKIEIPADLAIIGIDNTDLSSFMRPTLTTIDLHAEQRGAIAAQLMLERLSDPDRPIQKVVVEPTLVIRESTEQK